jgi:hypothetical protein
VSPATVSSQLLATESSCTANDALSNASSIFTPHPPKHPRVTGRFRQILTQAVTLRRLNTASGVRAVTLTRRSGQVIVTWLESVFDRLLHRTRLCSIFINLVQKTHLFSFTRGLEQVIQQPELSNASKCENVDVECATFRCGHTIHSNPSRASSYQFLLLARIATDNR